MAMICPRSSAVSLERERGNEEIRMYGEPAVEVGSGVRPETDRSLSVMDARCDFGPAPQRFVPPRPGNFPSHENSGR